MIIPKIINIQRFCLDDGDGIRTTVFLKGCPLSCKWCHNPESQSANPQLSFVSSYCCNCGQCAVVCPNKVHDFSSGQHIIDFSKCAHCGNCTKVCLKGCLEIIGENYSIENIMNIVKQDIPFYKNGGGLTISGGEPLLYCDFVSELASLAKQNNINVTIETSGYGSIQSVEASFPLVDQWLFDYKAGTKEKHIELCGVSNERIFENFLFLAKKNTNIRIRYPFIPGINDSDEDINILAKLIHNCNRDIPVQLMPYHILGISKAKNIGNQYSSNLPLENANEQDILAAKRKLGTLGITVI